MYTSKRGPSVLRNACHRPPQGLKIHLFGHNRTWVWVCGCVGVLGVVVGTCAKKDKKYFCIFWYFPELN